MQLPVVVFAAAVFSAVGAEREGIPPLPEPELCSSEPKANEYFSTDNFPSNFNQDYENRMEYDCNYTMVAPEGQKVLLTFHYLEMSGSYRCYDSSLNFFFPNGTLKNQVCGEAEGEYQVLSDTNSLTFNLKTRKYSSSRGFLASWKAVPAEYSQTQENKGLYFLTFPTNMVRKAAESICVDLIDTEHEKTELIVDVYPFKQYNKKAAKKFDFGEAEVTATGAVEAGQRQACLELTTDPAKDMDLVMIRVQIKDNLRDEQVFRFVGLVNPKDSLIIQTDKGFYKASDTVKFRILAIDDNLKSQAKAFSKVTVENPSRRTVQLWNNVELDSGITQREFELFEEAPLGQWSIKLYGGDRILGQAEFTVDEYVLPRFELKIKSPASIVRESELNTWSVCPVYTHGAPVKGTVEAAFSTQNYHSWRGVSKPNFVNKTLQTQQDKDCVDLELSSDELKQLKGNIRNSVNLQVQFTEDGTGETVDKDLMNAKIVDVPLKIDFGGSQKEFIVGGFPYTGTIRVTNLDGSKRQGERLEVCTRLFTDIQKLREEFQSMWNWKEDDFISKIKHIEALTVKNKCYEAVTDEKGEVVFNVQLPPIDKEVTKLSVRVKALDHFNEDEDEDNKKNKGLLAFHDVALKQTNAAGVALSLRSSKGSDEELECDQTNQVPLFISGKQGSSMDLKYYMIAGGVEIRSEVLSVSLDGENDLDKLTEGSQSFSLAEDETETDTVIKMATLSVPVDYSGFPDLQIVVMTNVGDEVLTASNKFKVGFCTEHKVELSLNTKKTTPRGDVAMEVKAGQGSMCGLSLTDKSVDLLGNNNKLTGEKVAELRRSAIRRKTSYYINNYELRNKCPEIHRLIKVFTDAGINVASNLPNFQDCVTLTIRDGSDEEEEYEEMEHRFEPPVAPQALAIVQEDIVDGPSLAPASAALRPQGSVDENGSPVVRTEFPETWLFSLEEADGNINKNLVAPDTLTSWTAEAVCLSPDLGLGLAKPQKLVVSQDFFSDLRLPYSVKRGEVFPLNISVFNSVEMDLPLTLQIDSEDVAPEETTFKLCLQAKSNQIVSVPTKASEVGDLNVTVSVTIENQEGCNPVEQGVGNADRLVRPLRVKPEGIPVEKVETELKCLDREDEVGSIKLNPLVLPEKIVDGSARTWAYVSGDIFASALQNIGNLVRMPTGCGEQNMVKLAPNIYLLEYLRNNDLDNSENKELKEKALRYMQIGYSRQEKYRHPGGAYSIWGGEDVKAGSTWLTAFVVKVFSQASEFIDVDSNKLTESINWLIGSQQENGCFEKRGYVYSSSLQGGNSEESLNAFVMMSLVEAGLKGAARKSPRQNAKLFSSIQSAKNCLINRRNESDLYAMSLATYALTLANQLPDMPLMPPSPPSPPPSVEDSSEPADWREKEEEQEEEDYGLKDLFALPGEEEEEEKEVDEVERNVEFLKSAANTSLPGAKFWDQSSTVGNNYWWSYSRSNAIEMTAYNVMSFVLNGQADEVIDAVKWMARQRNSQGGFVSTQDTVVALQALSVYGSEFSKYTTDMKVSAKLDDKALDSLNLDSKNKVLQQLVRNNDLTGSYNFDLVGSGCVLAQSVLRYNVPESSSPASFSLTVETLESWPPQLKTCFTYTGSRENTDMVIVELELVSGYKADSPDSLLNEVDSGVERVEEDKEENLVILYFNAHEKGQNRCVTLTIREEMKVEERKPARVSVYDYYNPEQRHEITYSV